MPPMRPEVTSEYPYGAFVKLSVSWTVRAERGEGKTHKYLGDEHRKARRACDEDPKYKEEDEKINALGSCHELLALSSAEFDRTEVKIECCTQRLGERRRCQGTAVC